MEEMMNEMTDLGYFELEPSASMEKLRPQVSDILKKIASGHSEPDRSFFFDKAEAILNLEVDDLSVRELAIFFVIDLKLGKRVN
jgi:hypothetical protein